jgi:Domain of unknown function (DU1801)
MGRVAGEVQEYLDAVASQKRRMDGYTLVGLMERATGEQPRMWGSIVGFGQYHYRYASGREGDAPAAGFAARKAASTVYVLDGVGGYSGLLDQLGPHSTGVGCIYIKDLSAVDLDVLESIVARSYATLTAGTFPNRARDAAEK